MKIRIVPVALGAVLLALPLQVEVVVRESTALAKSAQTPGFGNHPRPWAEDMMKRPEGEAGQAVAEAPQGGDAVALAAAAQAPASQDDPAATALCRAGKDEWQTRLTQLRAAETRVSGQVAKLAGLKADLEALLKQQEKAEDSDIQRLVNLYRNMKPVEAAVILADLDMPIVVSIVMSMSERDAAPILAQMPKAAAQQVTREIARQRSLDRLHKDLS